MILITMRKHWAEKLRPIFAILHRLEGVPESSSIPKQGWDPPKKSSGKPTTLVKPNFKRKSDPKGKEKLFSQDPIIDNSEEEELDVEELKRRKDREVELDEDQRIVRKAKAKEKVEREARSSLKRKKLLFPV